MAMSGVDEAMRASLRQLEALLAEMNTRWSPLTVQYLVPFVMQLVPYWAVSLSLLSLDLFEWPRWLYAHKLQKRVKVPPATVARVALNVVLNQLLVMPLVSLFWYALSVGRFAIRTDAPLPSAREFAIDLVLCLALLDVFFYYNHRAFHSKALWSFHAVHHELTAPIGLAADYLHPLEFFAMNSCAMLAAMLVNAHVVTLGVFFAIGNTGGVLNHSGYRLPWLPSWVRDPDYHDWHHSHPSSNFSFFQVLDYLHGTNESWVRHLQQREREKAEAVK